MLDMMLYSGGDTQWHGPKGDVLIEMVSFDAKCNLVQACLLWLGQAWLSAQVDKCELYNWWQMIHIVAIVFSN